MKKIFFITNYNNIIPQKLHETQGLDLQKVIDNFPSEFETVILNLDVLANNLLNIEYEIAGCFFVFCSSQIEEYKNAILDVAYEVNARGGVLIPKYDFYKSHENKYFQELYKARVGVTTPMARLLTTSNTNLTIDKPIVIKGYKGFGSRGVTLAKESKIAIKAVLRNMVPYVLTSPNFYEVLRNFVKKSVKYPGLYPQRFGRVVAQSFIPGLKYDWKVLVFGNQAFALKRYVNKNDFRASGSGNFDFQCIASDELLKFAFETKDKLNTPFVSLDIAESENGDFSIIEYQSVHFGLATLIYALQEYKFSQGNVTIDKLSGKPDIERYFANSIVEFIEKI